MPLTPDQLLNKKLQKIYDDKYLERLVNRLDNSLMSLVSDNNFSGNDFSQGCCLSIDFKKVENRRSIAPKKHIIMKISLRYFW